MSFSQTQHHGHHENHGHGHAHGHKNDAAPAQIVSGEMNG